MKQLLLASNKADEWAIIQSNLDKIKEEN